VNLLTIAQQVADEVGLPRPAALASATDQLARQMFALANAVLRDLGKQDWLDLQETHTFDTVATTSQYAVPAGYKRMVGDTAFNSDVHYAVRGALTAEQFRALENGSQLAVGRFRFRLTNGYINIQPTPQTAETLTFLYVTNYLARTSADAPQALFENDEDTPAVPEELVILGLKWRIKHAKGLEYGEDYNAYEEQRKTLMAQELGLGQIPVAMRWASTDPELGEFYVPETGFGT